MSDTAKEQEPVYHLLLDREEASTAASALRLFISDEAHQPRIRQLAREVLADLHGDAGEHDLLTVTLSAARMKITYSAVKLLLNDLQRGQAAERETLRNILEKLPDEHSMRAIALE